MSERGLGCEINYNDAISYYKNCLNDNAYAQYALAIEIRPDMRVIVRAPYQASGSYIEQFIADRTDWIVEHLRKLEQKNRQCNDALPVKKLSNNDIKELADKACACIPGRVAHFAPLVGVTLHQRNQT